MMRKRGKQAQAKNMSDIERAYMGALIDGEGSIIHKRYAGKSGNTTYFGFTVGNTDLELISACLRSTGTGRVYAQPWQKNTKTRCWKWDVGARNQVMKIAEQIASYSVKAQRLLEMAKRN